MGNAKSLVLVITSLTFLISGAICSQLFVQPAFAANPHYCFVHDCGGDRICDNDPKKGTATCCFRDPGTIPPSTTCQTCHVNTNTGEFENCTSASEGQTGPGIIAPPPSGVAPPTSTETCPENTARDVNGNCTPLTQTPEAPVPKSGPGNLLPEGVFEGPGTLPQQEVAPPGQPPNQPLCPEGQVLDEETGVCVPIECPEGQVLDEETGLCFGRALPQDAAQEQEAAEDQPQEVEEEQESVEEPEEQPTTQDEQTEPEEQQDESN